MEGETVPVVDGQLGGTPGVNQCVNANASLRGANECGPDSIARLAALEDVCLEHHGETLITGSQPGGAGFLCSFT